MPAEHRQGVACAVAVLAALSCRSADDPPQVIGDMVQLERLASAGDAVKIRDLLASDPGLAHASWASAQHGPLHIAATHGHLPALQTLLERGMRVDGRILRGEAPLHAAAAAGKVESVRFLLDHGASVNVRSHDGRTPLHAAIDQSDKPEVTDLLLSRGADPDLRDQDGRTPLHTAVNQTRLLQVAALCAAGAETGIRDEARLTPYELAKKGAAESTLRWSKVIPDWLARGGPCEQLRAKRAQGRPPTRGQRDALVFDTHCAAGGAWACGRVGRIYEEGQDGVAMDLVRAFRYAEKGCTGNDGFACGNVAYAHMTGKGAPRDDVRAAAFLLKGCTHDSAWSCSRLARLHRAGRGVPRDPIRAAELERKACEGGQKDACAPAAASR